MQLLLSNLATGLNRIDGVRGQGFDRRFSASEIVDAEALLDMITYAVTNPVEAGLVRSHREWPGLCRYVGTNSERHTFVRFRQEQYARAVIAAGRDAVDRNHFIDSETMELTPLEPLTGQVVDAAVAAREAEIVKRRMGKPWLGVQRVLATHPFDRPAQSKRSRQPLCHASSLELWLVFRAGWREFVRAYREASRIYRSGKITVDFPPYSFRPQDGRSPVPG